MPLLDNDFIDSLAELGKPYPRLKWYATAIVALSAINYPEEIPNFYSRLLEVHIPEAEKFNETRKIKEALTKVCGIQGAAKVGSSTTYYPVTMLQQFWQLFLRELTTSTI